MLAPGLNVAEEVLQAIARGASVAAGSGTCSLCRHTSSVAWHADVSRRCLYCRRPLALTSGIGAVGADHYHAGCWDVIERNRPPER